MLLQCIAHCWGSWYSTMLSSEKLLGVKNQINSCYFWYPLAWTLVRQHHNHVSNMAVLMPGLYQLWLQDQTFSVVLEMAPQGAFFRVMPGSINQKWHFWFNPLLVSLARSTYKLSTEWQNQEINSRQLIRRRSHMFGRLCADVSFCSLPTGGCSSLFFLREGFKNPSHRKIPLSNPLFH